MKALSIKQPWASLIAHGIKDIENRTWKTNFRGRIYIHASGIRVKTEYLNRYFSFEMTSELIKAISHTNFIPAGWVNIQPTSAIIGEVDIVDCVINHPSIWAESSGNRIIYQKPKYEDYYIGGNFVDYNSLAFERDLDLWKTQKPTYNWVLSNPVLYPEPILNVKGALSFWEYEKIVIAN